MLCKIEFCVCNVVHDVVNQKIQKSPKKAKNLKIQEFFFVNTIMIFLFHLQN